VSADSIVLAPEPSLVVGEVPAPETATNAATDASISTDAAASTFHQEMTVSATEDSTGPTSQMVELMPVGEAKIVVAPIKQEMPAATVSAGALVEEKKKKAASQEVLKFTYNEDDDKFRHRFDLPPEERIMDSYMCAITTSWFPYQGRLFVGNSCVCFYSGVNGCRVKMPYNQIVSITKENTAVVFPNSIQITLVGNSKADLDSEDMRTEDGKYFFMSFVMRDEAYKKILELWKIHTGLTEVLTGKPHPTSERRVEEPTVAESAGAVVKESPLPVEEKMEQKAGATAAADGKVAEEMSSGVFKSLQVQATPVRTLDGVIEESKRAGADSHGLEVVNIVLPWTSEQCFEWLFYHEDKEQFLTNYLNRQGKKDLKVGAWNKEVSSSGAHDGWHSRVVTYRSLLSGTASLLGSSECKVTDTHRIIRTGPESFFLETIAKMDGVPYSDSFLVVTFCEVSGLGPRNNTVESGCRVRLWFGIRFIKTIYFTKGFIKDNTLREGQDMYRGGLVLVGEVVRKKPKIAVERKDGGGATPLQPAPSVDLLQQQQQQQQVQNVSDEKMLVTNKWFVGSHMTIMVCMLLLFAYFVFFGGGSIKATSDASPESATEALMKAVRELNANIVRLNENLGKLASQTAAAASRRHDDL